MLNTAKNVSADVSSVRLSSELTALETKGYKRQKIHYPFSMIIHGNFSSYIPSLDQSSSAMTKSSKRGVEL